MFKDVKGAADGNNPERKEYLKHLVTEFKETKSFDAKQQVLANLANFAYDPVNYEYMRQHAVIDIFLDEISKNECTLMKFALAGLCNLSLDAENKDYILHCNGVKIMCPCLTSQDEDVVLSTITTLMFLINPVSKADITSKEIINQMIQLSHSPSTRIRNLASIFLEDYCTGKCLSGDTNTKCVLQDGMEVHVTRKITSEDVETFCRVTGDYNPIHRTVVHGALLNGLVSGVMGTKLPGPGTIVVSQKFQFPNPCYIDSNVAISILLLKVRKVMTCKYTCVSEDGKIVLEGEAKVIQKRLPSILN